MIKTIYVDMDGVLCDFNKRFLELYKDVPEVDYPSKSKEKKAYKSRFDDFVTGRHFATLEPMPDFEKGASFLESIESYYTITILSSTARELYLEEVSRQKEKWLADWEVSYPAIFVPGKKLKREYACPLGLLIDDTIDNVAEWREKGGKAILHKSWQQTIEEFDYYYA
jgi:hypothetical protein